jgi:hypothetical protein
VKSVLLECAKGVVGGCAFFVCVGCAGGLKSVLLLLN